MVWFRAIVKWPSTQPWLISIQVNSKYEWLLFVSVSSVIRCLKIGTNIFNKILSHLLDNRHLALDEFLLLMKMWQVLEGSKQVYGNRRSTLMSMGESRWCLDGVSLIYCLMLSPIGMITKIQELQLAWKFIGNTESISTFPDPFQLCYPMDSWSRFRFEPISSLTTTGDARS